MNYKNTLASQVSVTYTQLFDHNYD